MQQDGSGNKVKGILNSGAVGNYDDPAKLTGSAQTINIDQIGSGNTLALGVVTSQGGNLTGYSNIGINLNYQVTGSSNVGYININNNGGATSATKGNVIDIQQSGSTNDVSLSMTGASNRFTQTTSGDSNALTASVNADQTTTTLNETGNSNSTSLTMTGNKGTVGITLNGASNTTSITQSASGSTGAQALIDITGSSNQTTVTQSGGFDHYANIKINSTQAGSDSNVIAISQSGGSSAGQSASLDITGASNNISITQQGSVDNLANIKVTGNSNHYTVLQKN